MPWTWRKLIIEMDRKRLPRGVISECTKHGYVVFSYLLILAESNLLNDNQLANAVDLLFSLKMHVNDPIERSRYIKMICRLCYDSRERVRDKAIHIFFMTAICSMKGVGDKHEYISLKETNDMLKYCADNNISNKTIDFVVASMANINA